MPQPIYGNIAYLSIWMTEIYFQLSHGTNDGDHGLYGVAVHQRSILYTFILGVTLLMDNSVKSF